MAVANRRDHNLDDIRQPFFCTSHRSKAHTCLVDPRFFDQIQAEELMELTHTALDEAWKADGGGGARGSYPQARMAHLFDVIGAAFCRCLFLIAFSF